MRTFNVSISLDPRSSEMPGYQRTVKSMHRGDFRPAWNCLDLYSAKVAEEFLMEKIKRFTDDEYKQEAIFQVCLGFATMAVHTEREEQESLRRLKEAGKAATPASPESEDEPEDYREGPGIEW